MCGIAGFNFEVDKEEIFKTLYHRGPDERGFFSDKGFFLFHTRLAIQDVKNGHQPFKFNEWIIVFNGEIYNHLELRELLKEFNFKTSSDTETLLYLFIKYKQEMFKFIDGMFAFAIFNTKTNKLYLARDRAGKKPLYFYKKNQKFGFSSEINVFKFLDLSSDEEDIKLYLSTGFCESGYKEVREIAPSSLVEIDLDSLKFREFKYFDIYEYYKKEKIINFNEAKELIKDNLIKSIKNRLISSDVEVGAFLSGGIDSSLIVAIASEFQNIKTFTVKFDGSFDESNLAKLTAKRYGLSHTIIEIKMDVKDKIVEIIKSYGKPFFDSSAIPSYFVSKEARKHLKVVLNGDGADELFAGYRRYVPFRYNFFKFIRFLPTLNANTRGIKMFLYRLKRAFNKRGLDWYNVLLGDLFVDLYEFRGKKIELFDKFIKELNLDDFEKLLYLDFVWNLRYDLLIKMDIATMQNSLEARSPFLSKYLLEIAPIIDERLKVRNFKTKYILRELAKEYLDEEVVNAKKRGFEIPLVNWVNNELNEVIMDYLSYGFYKNFVDGSLVDKIIKRKISIPEEKRVKIIYQLFALEVWAYENSVS